jgi:hypothetical protein
MACILPVTLVPEPAPNDWIPPPSRSLRRVADHEPLRCFLFQVMVQFGFPKGLHLAGERKEKEAKEFDI